MRFAGSITRSRHGVAMMAAVCVLVLIGIVAIQFHHMSREAQLNAYRFQASEVARQLAESAMDEAFTFIFNQAGKSATDLHNSIVNNSSSPGAMDCTTGSLEDKNSKGVDIPVPLTTKVAADMNMANRFSIEVSARIIDFRSSDDAGRKYYGNEGVGTIELRARVEPKEDYKKTMPGACILTRHHDYKVVSIISKKSNRPAGYIHNQLLDYALFITRGREEFERQSGSNLNPQETRLTIDQSHYAPSAPEFYGKIYLGGTSGAGGKPVFIDLTSETSDFIPEPRKKDKISPPSPLNNVDSQSLVTKLYPDINEASRVGFNEIASKEGKSGDVRYKSCQLDGIESNFYYARFPTTDEAFNNLAGLTENQQKLWKYGRKGAWLSSQTAFSVPETSEVFNQGLKILPLDKLEHILQGKIRKRFFHYAYLIVDMHAAALTVFYEYKKPKFPSGYSWKGDSEGPKPLNLPNITNAYDQQPLPCFADIEALRGGYLKLDFLASRFPNPDLICRLISDYDYGPGTETDKFPEPTFYKFSDSMSLDGTDLAINEFRPFSHPTLWIRKDFPAERLEEYGILKNGELHLRGIIRVHGRVVLRGNSGAPLRTFGQGILIADEIVIESGIEKAEPDSICVLWVRGADKNGNQQIQTIWVKTDEKIEASLVAVGYGHNCRVIPENNTLNLYGAMAVDELDIKRWKKAVEHKIKYDPVLACDKDVYQVNLSRWVSFKRMLESEE